VAAKKVNIECVILAGFSLSRCQGPTPDFIVHVTVSLARAARDFFKDFGIQAPENPKFSLACMRMKAWHRPGPQIGLIS
jgi:hypothetical protein